VAELKHIDSLLVPHAASPWAVLMPDLCTHQPKNTAGFYKVMEQRWQLIPNDVVAKIIKGLLEAMAIVHTQPGAHTEIGVHPKIGCVYACQSGGSASHHDVLSFLAQVSNTKRRPAEFAPKPFS
jgi:hypothetical protein